MGKIKIRKVSEGEDLMDLSITSLLQKMKISKISNNYHIWLGSTEVEISADLMKDLIENAFMMLDYEDQIDLLKVFSEYVR